MNVKFVNFGTHWLPTVINNSSPSKEIHTEMNISSRMIQKHTRGYDKETIIISKMEMDFFQISGFNSK